jgi:hypothetical protein
MKEIVLVTLAIDTETGEINPKAPFMVNSRAARTPDITVPTKMSRALSSNSGPASVKFDSRPSGMLRKKIGYSGSGSTTLDVFRRLSLLPLHGSPHRGRRRPLRYPALKPSD